MHVSSADTPQLFARDAAAGICAQTVSKTNGRYIDRSEYADVVEANSNRVGNNPGHYRVRQLITKLLREYCLHIVNRLYVLIP